MLGGFFGGVANIGKHIESAAMSLFDSGNAADDDAEKVGGELFIESEEQDKCLVPTGHGYEFGYMYYKNDQNNDSTYFYTTQLGAPFPSYHSNPLPNFPARWTSIPRVKPPVESVVAPRIRLGPRELSVKLVTIMGKIREAATSEEDQPLATTLNLSHQCLGDPYQYEAFVTFIDLNRFVRVLNLNDNELDDITDLDLPNCVKLYVSHNSFVSFYGLPELPVCEELYATNNFFSGLAGLSDSRFPKLRILNVDRNPIEHLEDYRKAIRERVPTVHFVDDQEP